jgi:tetratricopeptide (TPR) repeat protein
LNPDLPLAHNFYAELESERGRALEAMTRLLKRALAQPNDPDLFAGLVHSCRYCGLVEASVAAHQQAHRLDPNIRTSVTFTYFAIGDYEAALEACPTKLEYSYVQVLATAGREREAIAALQEWDRIELPPVNRLFRSALGALLAGNKEECMAISQRILAVFTDPEGIFYIGRHMAYFGETAEFLPTLNRVVERGFYCLPAFARDPWLDPMRTNPEFLRILQLADKRCQEARAAFIKAGGERLLGAVHA